MALSSKLPFKERCPVINRFLSRRISGIERNLRCRKMTTQCCTDKVVECFAQRFSRTAKRRTHRGFARFDTTITEDTIASFFDRMNTSAQSLTKSVLSLIIESLRDNNSAEIRRFYTDISNKRRKFETTHHPQSFFERNHGTESSYAKSSNVFSSKRETIVVVPSTPPRTF